MAAEIKSLRAKWKRAMERAAMFEAKYKYAVDEYSELAHTAERMSERMDRIESEHHTVLRMSAGLMNYNTKMERDLAKMQEEREASAREEDLFAKPKTNYSGDN